MVVLVVQGKWNNAALNRAAMPAVAVNLGVPLALAIVPAATGAFGPSGPWCWIKPDAVVLRFVCYYGILIAALLYSLVCLGVLLAGGHASCHEIETSRCMSICGCGCRGGGTGRAAPNKGSAAAAQPNDIGTVCRPTAATEQLRVAAARRLGIFCAVFFVVRIWSIVNRVNEARSRAW